MTEKIRTAIVGVGNCCSALVQGIFYVNNEQDTVGLTHFKLENYTPKDIEFVAAFDVDGRKVGKDLSEAIFSEPNKYAQVIPMHPLNVKVCKGPLLDISSSLSDDMMKISSAKEEDVSKILEESKAEVVVNFLPSGADKASEFYANVALETGCAYINATPAPIACNSYLAEEFLRKRLPLIGDDVMSQIGGTILHKNILEFLASRGVRVFNTYQVDAGGGIENCRILNQSVKTMKRNIKTEAVKASVPYDVDVVAGTTDYVDFMKNSRASYYWIQGEYFLGSPITLDIVLRILDAPNSASIIIDSIRAAKIALTRGAGGLLPSVCAYGYKRLPKQIPKVTIQEAHRAFMEFIEGRRSK